MLPVITEVRGDYSRPGLGECIVGDMVEVGK